MTGVTIERLAGEEDIDGVLAVEDAAFTNPWTRDMYLADLAHRDVSHILLAKHEGRVVGFCSFWRVVDEIHINNLAVLQEYRRRGIASALLARVFMEAGRTGAVRATLEVRRSNDAARRLYEGMNFVVAGVRRGYYSKPPEDALVLWRDGFPEAHLETV